MEIRKGVPDLFCFTKKQGWMVFILNKTVKLELFLNKISQINTYAGKFLYFIIIKVCNNILLYS